MKLILMRHGQAGAYVPPDSERELTDFGRQQADETAQYLVKNFNPDLLIVSPYIRAKQTLAEVQKLLPNTQLQIYPHITPDDNAKEALRGIGELIDTHFENSIKTADKCVLVVCHMPIVAYLSSLLTDKEPEAFALAEMRVLETEFIAMGLAIEIDRFIPKQTLLTI